jgi:hypothetical protein
MQVKQINTPLHTPPVTLLMHTLQAHARATVGCQPTVALGVHEMRVLLVSPYEPAFGPLQGGPAVNGQW